MRDGKLEERLIEVETQDRSNTMIDFVGGQGMEEMGVNLRDMFGNMFPSKTIRRKIKISEAKKLLLRDEQENLVDMEEITQKGDRKH